MATFEDVLRLALQLPEVEESTSYGTPSFKVKGKMICRLWGEREHDRDDVHDTEVLALHCDIEEKEALIESSGGALFSTPHYEGYGMVLARLADITPDDLAGLLEDSYCLRAPKTLLENLDRDRRGS